MSRAEKVTRPVYCEGEIRDPVMRAWRIARKGGDLQCSSRASHMIDGKPLCRRHAGVAALEILEKTP